MIAKHIPMRSLKKSDYQGLIAYLIAPQNKQERVGQIRTSQCASDEALAAAWEIQHTQSFNMRAASDKTYHLVVSFRNGEQPTESVVAAIEERICNGLGFGEHQRISVVHHDTDNLHVHIAINKIHPTKLTIHNPYRDYATLARLCTELEERFGLERDNHTPRRQGEQSQADSMEHHAGVESLLGWIRRECLDVLKGAESWTALHDALASHGLVLRARGNGLIVVAGDGTAVKASSIDRHLSKAALEKRFGPFEAVEPTQVQDRTRAQYVRAPMNTGFDTSVLYKAYLECQSATFAERAAAYDSAREQKEHDIAAARRRARTRRAAMRLAQCDRSVRKALHGVIHSTLVREIEQIRATYRDERRQIASRYRRQAWVDWLCTQAQLGSDEALSALRSRPGRDTAGANAVGGDEVVRQASTGHVTKHGTIIFKSGGAILRDAGDRLLVARQYTQADVRAVLHEAVKRFGTRLHVDGDEAFRRDVARMAGRLAMAVVFDDPALERARTKSIIHAHTRENQHEHASEQPGGRGPSAGGSIQGDRRNGSTERTAAGDAKGPERDAGAIGTRPPPEGRHRLRDLSALGMVRIADGTEVLLPGDVPRHVEQPGAAADHGVRRPVPGHRQVGEGALAAIHKYVLEREQKRLSLRDIPKHRAYDGFQGPALFGGLRTVDGHTLALLRREDGVHVMAIDAATARRLSKLGRGVTLQVGPKGITREGRHR